MVDQPDYTSLDLPAPPADRPYVLVNMVMSADGKTVIEGTEQGIGSATDRRLMRELRVNADLILTGAGTLRATGASPRLGDPALEDVRLARGKPRFPTSAVLSRTGRLPLDRNFFTARDFESLVYLSSGASKRARHAIIATGRPLHEVPVGNEVPAMLRHMRHELGAGVLLVEGGPEMNAQLFRLDAVDEYFLTLGAVIVGGRRTLTAVGGDVPFTRETARRLELISAAPNDETAEVYLRYRVRR